ncbi:MULTISPECIES: HEPN domain-containing protein [unclassified Anabaena]|uniref:HEPN domain-containing protein n=1 Tax=unclassified Anabaena TaxID=2619674 RepID=UPI0039C6D1B3
MIEQPITIVDKIYQDNQEILDFLDKSKEISLKARLDIIFKKTLLLSAASYFEEKICNMLQEFVKRTTQNDKYIVSLVKKKAIERQYHTYFQWNGNNANQFFSLFGEEFKIKLQGQIDDNDALKTSVKAFLELGETRNKLVHLNFANYPLEKTAEEIYQMYQKSLVFIDFLDNQFSNTNEKSNEMETRNY